MSCWFDMLSDAYFRIGYASAHEWVAQFTCLSCSSHAITQVHEDLAMFIKSYVVAIQHVDSDGTSHRLSPIRTSGWSQSPIKFKLCAEHQYILEVRWAALCHVPGYTIVHHYHKVTWCHIPVLHVLDLLSPIKHALTPLVTLTCTTLWYIPCTIILLATR